MVGKSRDCWLQSIEDSQSLRSTLSCDQQMEFCSSKHSLKSGDTISPGAGRRAYNFCGLPPACLSSQDDGDNSLWWRRQGWPAWTWFISVAMTSVLLTLAVECIRGAHPHMGSHQQALQISKTANNPSQMAISERSTCGSGGSEPDSFNMPLRVGAVFIIMAVSTAACAFPILAAKSPELKMPDGFFFSVRHFGTGVLIATAFVHLLPTAFILLGDACLSGFWTDDYPAMPGAIALAGIFIVTVIEMLLHPARGTPKYDQTGNDGASSAASRGGGVPKRVLRGRSESIGRSLSHLTRRGNAEEAEDGDRIEGTNGDQCELGVCGQQDTSTGREIYDANNLTPDQRHKKEVMHCILLEIGILFHSVFIGMALSVTIGGSEFVILLIAIIFHQTFEGLALGARISAIAWPEKSWRPILMALAYGCTTPVGQAIGLAARSAYSPDSEVGLILVGVMNAISAGLLVFAALVELLSEDLLTDESWRVLRGRRRVFAFLLVVAGAFGMSLVGAWA